MCGVSDENETGDLFEKGSEGPSLPKESLHRAYEAVMDRCARLLSFASSRSYDTWINIDERQTALAIDDLVALALHARRLINDAHFSGFARNVSVPTITAEYHGDHYRFPKRGDYVAITRLFNVIIHHDLIEIYRDSGDLLVHALRAHGTRLALDDILRHEIQQFPAKLMMKSDKSDVVFVDLSEFLLLFVERVLDPLVDRCADGGVYLRDSLYE
jgi:hypothetical protein